MGTLVFIAVVYFLFFRRRAWLRRQHGYAHGWWDHWSHPRRAGSKRARACVGAAAPIAPAPRRLTPMQEQELKVDALRKRYVRDEITVEQYERELDKLLRT